MLLFLILLLASLAIAQNPYCLPANPPASLPSCTVSSLTPSLTITPAKTPQHKCLDSKDTDGTCADNLRGFCDLSSGVYAYFQTYGDCLMSACNDGDKYAFMAEFKSQCEGTRNDWKTADIGEWKKYLEKPVTSTKAETKPSSTEKEVKSSTRDQVTVKSSMTSTSTSTSPTSNPPTTQPTPQDTRKPVLTIIDLPSTDLLTLPSPSSLVNALNPNDQPTPNADLATTRANDSPPPSTATQSIPSHSHSHPATPHTLPTPTIAGAAAGGTAFLALAIGAVLYILRRRKRHRKNMRDSGEGRWDPNRGVDVHAGREAKLPDVGLRGGDERGDGGMGEVGGREIQAGGRASGVSEKEGDGSERYAVHGVRQNPGFKKPPSPFPELESRSPTLPSLPSPARSPQPPQTWHSSNTTGMGASELHSEPAREDVGIPVSELDVQSPVAELDVISPVVRMNEHREGTWEPVEMGGGREGSRGAVEIDGGEARVSMNDMEGGRGVGQCRYYARGPSA